MKEHNQASVTAATTMIGGLAPNVGHSTCHISYIRWYYFVCMSTAVVPPEIFQMLGWHKLLTIQRALINVILA